MKICLIAESYPPALGGVEFALQQIVEGLIAKGNEVWVVTSSWQRHPPGVEKKGSLRISRIYVLPFFKRIWFILFSFPSVLRAARWADIVQGSTFAGGPPAFLGAWLSRKRKVLLVHEVYGCRWFQFERNPLRALFYFVTERIIVRLPFDHYVAPSQYSKDSLCSLGVRESKVSVIYHGDSKLENPALTNDQVRNQLGFGKDDFIFVSFGRAGVTKGFECFAEAMAEISKEIPRARFVLILSGYDRRIWSRLEKKISTLPADVCKLVPPLSREMLASYVSAADCIVIPSLSEGFGFSALEACNANKVVVLTDAGSLREIVFGRHIFVAPGSAAAIVEGCKKAYAGEVEESAPKLFEWGRTVSQYCVVYDRLLGK
ncbi:MAG: glycosyltransferase family 4 protein [Ignavibacteriales bacterium]|nr:glycosyltransferase family 4 protein [Ignavibacteriales bacterium]